MTTTEDVTLHVVTTRHLCQACTIVEGVVRQMMDTVTKDISNIKVTWTVYETMEEAFGHPLLEVPKFPAIFIGDEQLTAGEIPTREDIQRWIAE